VAIAAIAAAAATATSFGASVRKAFLSKWSHGITFAPAPDCCAWNGTVIDSEGIVERVVFQGE